MNGSFLAFSKRGSFGLAAFFLAFLGVTADPGGAQVPAEGWEVAGPYPAARVAREGFPNFYAIFLAPWASADAGDGGSIDLQAHVARENEAGDLALARTTFFSPDSGVVVL